LGAPLQVVCSILINDQKKLLLAQRSVDMRHPRKWEFPGGKIVQGETAEEALKREILEELNLDIQVGERLTSVLWNYPDLSIELIPFVCKPKSAKPLALEHQAFGWFDLEEVRQMDLVEADVVILKELQGKIEKSEIF
jgi:8-oxo-dGTP diphosphatase